MTDAAKSRTDRAAPRRLKGFRDLTAADLLARDGMIRTIREVYEAYGFSPLETPALEYVDVLGKFLPESDRPDGGVFAFRDENDEWVALRYDLTAPLSRFVAMNRDLPKPFRRYQVGPVYRMEKPGPGRFREFYQFDFDTVGTGSMLADAECCMIMCDTLEALGIHRGDYVIRLNNRKVLNGVMDALAAKGAVPAHADHHVLRSIDKLDRVGLSGVRDLLGPGRKDESGDFMRGVGLSPAQITLVSNYLSISGSERAAVCAECERAIGSSTAGR